MTDPTNSADQPGWVQVLAIGQGAQRTIRFQAIADEVGTDAEVFPAQTTADGRILYRLRSRGCYGLAKSARGFLRPYRIEDTTDVRCDPVIAIAVIDAFDGGPGGRNSSPDLGAGPVEIGEIRKAFTLIELPQHVHFVKLSVLQKYTALGFSGPGLAKRAKIFAQYGLQNGELFAYHLRHYGHFQRMTQAGVEEFFASSLDDALERMDRFHLPNASYFYHDKPGTGGMPKGFELGDFLAKPSKTGMTQLREACVRYLESNAAVGNDASPLASSLDPQGINIYIAQGPQGQNMSKGSERPLCRVGVSDMSDEKLSANLNRILKSAIKEMYGQPVDFTVVKRYPVADMRPASVFVQMIAETYASPDHRGFVEAGLADLTQEIDRFLACWSIHIDKRRTTPPPALADAAS